MDIQQYIASGILEQYALNLLTDEERREVERMAAEHPEVRSELDAIEVALERYALLHSVAPSPTTLEGLLDRINVPPKLPPTPPTSSSTLATGGNRWLSVLFLLSLLLLGVLWWSQYSSWQRERSALAAQLEQQTRECEQLRGNLQQANAMLRILRDTSSRTIYLRGTALSPQAIAVVYWNPSAREAYLDVIHLPPPPAGKQYQLWAIVDNQPQDMGVFNLPSDAAALLSVPFVATPQAFAVTLEDAGGSPAPTLDAMYIIGEV